MKKKIVVLNIESYMDGWPPRSIMGFKDWTDSVIERIPEEYRGDAYIDIESYDEYGSTTEKIEVYYNREETEQEIKDRRAAEERKADEIIRREKNLFEALKQKYGDV